MSGRPQNTVAAAGVAGGRGIIYESDNPSSAHLSDAHAKARTLAEFAKLRKQTIPSGDLGGRGYPDHDILPFCDWLNSFDEIYTLQSCAGHLAREGHIESQGRLWVWIGGNLLDLFRIGACELSMSPFIDRVCSIYSEQGEFVEITFLGNESGQLLESLAALKSFFGSLIAKRALA